MKCNGGIELLISTQRSVSDSNFNICINTEGSGQIILPKEFIRVRSILPFSNILDLLTYLEVCGYVFMKSLRWDPIQFVKARNKFFEELRASGAPDDIIPKNNGISFVFRLPECPISVNDIVFLLDEEKNEYATGKVSEKGPREKTWIVLREIAGDVVAEEWHEEDLRKVGYDN
jgi:hypothetical protein